MKKEIYDKVGTVSVLLNEKLKELKSCKEEKEELLKYIDQLTEQGLLEKNSKIIKEKMSASLERFKKVVAEIEELNNN